MGTETKIAWCHHTLNPWRGCTRVSEGCRNCYAETMSARNHAVLGVWGPRGTRAPAVESYWRQLRKWNAAAAKAGERRRVFCASLADVFEGDDTMPAASRPLVHAARERLWREIEACAALDFLLLTKRPENAAAMVPRGWAIGWPRNVWFGFSAEDQPSFDARWQHASQVPAAIIWCSYEPALGPIDFDGHCYTGMGALRGWHAEPVHVCGGDDELCYRRCPEAEQVQNRALSWVIVGGESGPNARPFDVAWARSVVEQCRAAGCAPFVKQLGRNIRVPRTDAIQIAGRGSWTADSPGAPYGTGRTGHPAGADPAEWPEDLRVQEFP